MRVIRLLLKHKVALFFVCLFFTVQVACDLALPQFSADIIDIGILGEGIAAEEGFSQSTYLLLTGLEMMAVVLLSCLAHIAMNYFATGAASKISFDLREKMYARILSFSENEMSHFSSASLITRFTNDIQQIQMSCLMIMRLFIYSIIMAIGGLICFSAAGGKMIGIVFLAVVISLVTTVVLLFVTVPKFRIMQKLVDRVNLISREALTGLPVIRSFNRTRHEEKRFASANDKLMRTQLFTNRVTSAMQPLLMLIMNGLAVGIVALGTADVDAGTLLVGDLVKYITYAMQIILSFVFVGVIAIILPRAEVAAARVEEVLSTTPTILAPAPTSESCDKVREDAAGSGGESFSAEERAEVAVEFRHVCFSDSVLNNVTFSVMRGETLAIVGATGSGKSTLLKLLLRFYDPRCGEIFFDNTNIRDFDPVVLRQKIAYVPQRSFLFNTSIYENVSYAYGDEASGDASAQLHEHPQDGYTADANARRAHIEEALHAAQADFAWDLPQGLLTCAGQKGSALSGGQKQRICIARALAKPAEVYLFDDCFSALDCITDAALRHALAEKTAGKTKIIVASRIATVMHADRIVVLDEGKVVGIGTHDELLVTCPAYAALASSQLSVDELLGKVGATSPQNAPDREEV